MSKNLTRGRIINIVALLVFVAVLAPFVMYAVPQAVGATQSYVVLSGSMSPTIQTGDVILVYERDPQQIEEGDVITYNLDGQQREVTTHRVVDIVRTDDGARQFVTKGDANEDPDQYRVPPDAVVGVMPTGLFPPSHIPLLGHFLLFAQSKEGIALLVFVPAGLLVVSEVWDLYQEATGNAENETEESDTTEAQRESVAPMGEDD